MKALILMVGVPGSGKTTARNSMFPDIPVICPDELIGYTKEKPWTPAAAKYAWVESDKMLNK